MNLNTLRRGVLKRFLPASATVFFSIAFWLAMTNPTAFGWVQVGVLLVEVSMLTVGYGTALIGIRQWLRPDAGVDGRRSVVAGSMSPLTIGILSVFSQGSSLAGIVVISLAAGALMGLTMFFPWLQRRSPLPRGGLEPVSFDEDAPADWLPGLRLDTSPSELEQPERRIRSAA